MARKNKNERIILEDVELKPQVIGYTFQKKHNLGRVIFIFIIFALVVFYINDISLFINNLLGRSTADSIANSTNNKKPNNNDNGEHKELIYNTFSNSLEIIDGNIKLNNFKVNENDLTFDVLNMSESSIDLADKKYFLETYSANKTLLERFKVDLNNINASSKISLNYNLTKDFYYIVFIEKEVSDYPNVNLKYNETTNQATISCYKNNSNIIYTFLNDELISLKHTISNSNVNDQNYYTEYNKYQNLIPTYDNIPGISATFNGTLNGFTAIVEIDFEKANLSTVEEKYYYSYKEVPKVVKFEMETYGYSCN